MRRRPKVFFLDGVFLRVSVETPNGDVTGLVAREVAVCFCGVPRGSMYDPCAVCGYLPPAGRRERARRAEREAAARRAATRRPTKETVVSPPRLDAAAIRALRRAQEARVPAPDVGWVPSRTPQQ